MPKKKIEETPIVQEQVIQTPVTSEVVQPQQPINQYGVNPQAQYNPQTQYPQFNQYGVNPQAIAPIPKSKKTGVFVVGIIFTILAFIFTIMAIAFTANFIESSSASGDPATVFLVIFYLLLGLGLIVFIPALICSIVAIICTAIGISSSSKGIKVSSIIFLVIAILSLAFVCVGPFLLPVIMSA